MKEAMKLRKEDFQVWLAGGPVEAKTQIRKAMKTDFQLGSKKFW